MCDGSGARGMWTCPGAFSGTLSFPALLHHTDFSYVFLFVCSVRKYNFISTFYSVNLGEVLFSGSLNII